MKHFWKAFSAKQQQQQQQQQKLLSLNNSFIDMGSTVSPSYVANIVVLKW